MKKWMKWAAAAVFGAAVCCAGASLPAGADVAIDGDTLILSGNVTRDEVWDAGVTNLDLDKVVAEEGTVLPEDCSNLFDVVGYNAGVEEWSPFDWVISIDLSKADASHVKNMQCMFYECFHLEKVNIASLDTSNVTNMKCMFAYCTYWEELNITSLDTSNVTDMSCMFSCTSLTELDLSSFDTCNVTNMSAMFDSCTDLTELDLSNFDTEKVENMHFMFSECYSLESVDLSSFNTSNVRDMSYMFEECKALETLDLSVFDMSNVYNAKKMFSECKKLKTIFASDKWNMNAETDGTDMFYICRKLVGGNGTVYNGIDDIQYAHIDGGAKNPGYLTYKARGNQARGVSITLGGELAVHFFLELHPDTAQIKVTGPENSVYPTGTSTVDAAWFPNVSGKPREATVSYPINATQAGETIMLEFLDSDGNPLPVYNSDGVRFADDKLTYSAQQYIDDTPLYSDNAKLKALVKSLDNYCRAAHNFFFHKNEPVYGIEDVTIAQFEPYNYPLYGTEIALILNSKIEARIYSDNVIPEPFNGDGYLPTLFGTDQGYYFIYDIGAPQLASTETYQIGDTAFKFSPLTYGYYIMKKSDDESLKTLVRALYVYAQAAQAYPNGTD